jgi:4-oxalocrotonate tautomerase
VKGKIQCRSFRFGSSRKQQMISKLTDAMVSIEGENMRNVTWCVV